MLCSAGCLGPAPSRIMPVLCQRLLLPEVSPRGHTRQSDSVVSTPLPSSSRRATRSHRRLARVVRCWTCTPSQAAICIAFFAMQVKPEHCAARTGEGKREQSSLSREHNFA